MTVKLLTENHLEFLCLTGGCTGLSESTLVKMPNCWKSHVVVQLSLNVPIKSVERFITKSGPDATLPNI